MEKKTYGGGWPTLKWFFYNSHGKKTRKGKGKLGCYSFDILSLLRIIGWLCDQIQDIILLRKNIHKYFSRIYPLKSLKSLLLTGASGRSNYEYYMNWRKVKEDLQILLLILSKWVNFYSPWNHLQLGKSGKQTLFEELQENIEILLKKKIYPGKVLGI